VQVGTPRGTVAPEDRFVDMIVLEDLCYKMELPCILDVKMGTRQYGLLASAEKIRSKNAKMAKSTSATLGLRVAGLKMFDRLHPDQQITKSKAECRYLGPLDVEQLIFEFCQQSAALCGHFARHVDEIRQAFVQQTAYRLFTSSLLLMYDAMNPQESTRVVVVDFAYTYTVEELHASLDDDRHMTKDEGFLRGLDSLAAMLSRNANDISVIHTDSIGGSQ
jgi:hypothetical protein